MSNSSTSPPSVIEYFIYCFQLHPTYYHFLAFALVTVPLVLPLCLYILHLGLQQWRTSATISHTDLFTYNVVVVQLLNIAASCVLVLNWFFINDLVTKIGLYINLVTYSAVIAFQIFTCLERYTAVVHPITYLGLKSPTWTLIRNISCGLVWLHSVTLPAVFSQMINFNAYFTMGLFGYSLSLLLVFVCNLCLLCALLRPRPGGGASGRKSYQKAFYTITAITGTLLVKFGGDLFSTVSFALLVKHGKTVEEFGDSCTLYFSVIWFTLPSSLVLPLLFLHRNKKLPSCKKEKAGHVSKQKEQGD